MERLERKAKKYDDESKNLAENINAINKDMASQKVDTHYSIEYNMPPGVLFFFCFFFQWMTNRPHTNRSYDAMGPEGVRGWG